MSNRKLACAAALPLFFFLSSGANAACIPISDAAGLQAMQNNLAGNYCLTADIDLSSIANFTPVGNLSTPFVGKFNGNNHVISNLKITSSDNRVGLFGATNSGPATSGPIQNVTLTNARIKAMGLGSLVGTIIGEGNGATIRNIHVDGSVTCTQSCMAGGLASSALTVENSSVAVNVTSTTSPQAAGVIFSAPSGGTITETFSTGNVTCGESAFCGGFLGAATGPVVSRSYASGNVTCGAGSFCGGFGSQIADGSFTDVYATGATFAEGISYRAGFMASSSNNTFTHAFATGSVNGGTGTPAGFFAFGIANTFTDVYWDTDTSGMTSDGGAGPSGAVGKTTAQMQAALPAGFDPKIWGITPA